MIRYGLGTDLVEIARFSEWHKKPYTQLVRIFSAEEIAYVLAEPTKTAERFAVRFAAREAFFKALHALFPHAHIPLLSVLRNVQVTHTANGAPQLIINWKAWMLSPADKCHASVQISLTHTRTIAAATILIVW